MSIKNRLVVLERHSKDSKPMMPGLVLFVDGERTPEQQSQIEQAEAIGQPVIIFTVEDASAYPKCPSLNCSAYIG